MAEDDALPPAAVREILLRLPVDQRARAACVCCGWRDAAAEHKLWTVLDLTQASGVTLRLAPELLLAAAARAQGRLEVLNVPGVHLLLPAVRDVATANATSLREVRTLDFDEYDWLDYQDQREPGVDDLQALLLAAPALQVLEASVVCGSATARRLLRNEPPFGPLRLWQLVVDCRFDDVDIAPLVADISKHPSLRSLELTCGQHFPLTPAKLDSVVTAALTHHLTMLNLHDCTLRPEVVPALCRLLSSTALTCLCIVQLERWVQLLDAHAAVLLADALRANRTLTELTLDGVLADSRDMAVVVLALVAHASLRKLECISYFMELPEAEDEYDGALTGAALGALVAADAPALEELSVASMLLGDAGLGPLCAALPRNTHLRELWFDGHFSFSGARLSPRGSCCLRFRPTPRCAFCEALALLSRRGVLLKSASG